ncbi:MULTISPECIES: gamma-glutamylcyclotransferase family protein [Halomonas]|uniref:AIG2-like family protein n=1 Tax=Halomonas chromatireducens TaxID=507626 RepID=A0A109UMY4_9GAMM|nr:MULTISPECIES: gamma-glutamylcyclotransferase family protein [Halomonas]AMD02171.1 AIG2-like family protein [Halomonas chromatireducens]MBZ0328954.1 gamma-glutamylcyclotransferase [Halomonas sp. ANAO-440]
MPYYFAYGSNMNMARVAARIGATRRSLPGVLHQYDLRFDKASRVAGIAHANVVPSIGGRVEGALFELTEPEQIELMDPYEGYPHEYERHRLPVVTEEGAIPSWVYIAAPGTTSPSLKPAREYLAHLLAGEAFLSVKYYRQLSRVEVVSGLDDATLHLLGLSRHSPR